MEKGNMLINTLQLRNFGAIKNADLDFQPGINLIMGANGQGKTHIIHAIAHLLVNFKLDSFADFCRWGSNSYMARIAFEHEGKEFDYTHEFALEANKLHRTGIVAGNRYEESALKEELEKYFDPVLCNASILSFQGELDLVKAKPAARLDNLKRIYDLNFDTKPLKEEADAYEKKLSYVVSKIESLVSKKYPFRQKETLPFSEDKYQSYLGEIRSGEATISELTEKKRGIEESVKDVRRAEGEALSLSYQLAENGKRVSKAKEQIEQTNKNIALYESQLEAHVNEASNLVLNRLPKNPSVKIEETRDLLSSVTNLVERLKKDIELIDTGACPTCGKPFCSEDRAAKVASLERAEEEKVSLLYALSTLKTELSKYESAVKENTDTEKKKEQAKLKVDSLRALIVQSKEVLSASVESLNMSLANGAKLSETIDALNSEIKLKSVPNAAESIATLDRSISATKDSISTIAELVRSYEDVENRNKVVDQVNSDLEVEKKEDAVKASELETEKVELALEIERRRTARTILEKDFPNFVIGKLKTTIEEGIESVVDKVYGGRYLVKLKQTPKGIDLVYGPSEVSVATSASGFEQQLFNIGYKVAFVRVSGIPILFLDEVDAYADESNSSELFKLLGDMRSEYTQIFIITHKERVREALIRDYQAKAWLVRNGEVEAYT